MPAWGYVWRRVAVPAAWLHGIVCACGQRVLALGLALAPVVLHVLGGLCVCQEIHPAPHGMSRGNHSGHWWFCLGFLMPAAAGSSLSLCQSLPVCPPNKCFGRSTVGISLNSSLVHFVCFMEYIFDFIFFYIQHQGDKQGPNSHLLTLLLPDHHFVSVVDISKPVSRFKIHHIPV